MYRHSAILLPLLLVLVGCGDLRVPPPPVPFTDVDSIEASFDDTELLVGTATSVRLVRALPPGALAAVHLPDIAGSGRRFERTGLYQILTSPGVRQAFGGSFDFAPLKVNGGTIDSRRLMKALQGEFVVALEDLRFPEDSEVPEVRAVGGLTVRGAEADAEQLVAMLGALAAGQDGIKVEKGTAAGCPFTRLVGKEPFPWIVEAAVYHDALLVGYGRETVTEAIHRLADDELPSLAEAQAFSQAMSRCASPRDAVRVYVDLASVMAKYAHYLPRDGKSLLRGFGFNELRSFMMAVALEGEDITVSTLLDSPGGKDFLTHLLAAHPVDRQFVGRIPANAGAFSLFALDGRAILDQLRKALPDEDVRQLEDGLEGIRKDGVDLEHDIFEVFGPRCALVNIPQERAVLEPLDAIWNHLLGTAVVIELQDPSRAVDVLKKLHPSDPTIEKREFVVEGTRAVTYRLEGGELPRDFAVCYAISDGYLVVTPSEETLRRMLRTRLPDTAERYRALIKDVPDPAAVITYEDLNRGSSLSMQMFLTALATGAGGRPPERPIDFAMPDLGESISYTVADEHGVFSYTRSPTGGFGSVGGVAGLAVISAIAIPNVLQARMTANENAAISSLHAIHTAQVAFRGQASRDTDRDGDGEFGFLAELLGMPRPGEDRTLNRRRLVAGTWQRHQGDYVRNGYYFRVYLPAEDGSPIGENAGPVSCRRVDGDLAESIMVVTAWPISHGTTGRRAFVLTASGRIWECEDGEYGGRTAPPPDIRNSQEGNLASRPMSRAAMSRDGFSWVPAR
jgi:hypothetical protein